MIAHTARLLISSEWQMSSPRAASLASASSLKRRTVYESSPGHFLCQSAVSDLQLARCKYPRASALRSVKSVIVQELDLKSECHRYITKPCSAGVHMTGS